MRKPIEFKTLSEFQEFCEFWGHLPGQKTIHNGSLFAKDTHKATGEWSCNDGKYTITLY